MAQQEMNRRCLLRATAVGAVAGLAGWKGLPNAHAAAETTVQIVEPIHGAVLNRRHGKRVADGLAIRVAGRCGVGDWVSLNGVPCRVEQDRFETDVVLRSAETDLRAVVEREGRRCEDRVRVVWDSSDRSRYRFQIDDNLFFLRDIAEKQYSSLLDCFYLKMLHDLHTKYGAKFTLNVFYQSIDGNFKLSDFPDRYRSQWRDNADWLRLAFHAYCELPDRPYQDAPPEKLIADLDAVAAEIRRFAGEATYVPPSIVHWGMTRPSAYLPLYTRGVRTLSGYFSKAGTRWDVNYNLDGEHSAYLSRHNAWKHFESGIVFSRTSMVCNSTPIERIVPTLASLAKDPNLAEIMDLLTHEQYFWPFYKNYLPDHAQRLDTALRWCTDEGYQPIFCHEGVVG
jgi:hypothetical protein